MAARQRTFTCCFWKTCKMRETLTRSLSGIIYIALLTVATYSSPFTFLLLFGTFLGVCIQEFCDLVHIRKTLPILSGLGLFIAFTQFSNYHTGNLLMLGISLIVSVKCLIFLFDNRRQSHDETSKYLYLLGYLVFPFILITRIPFIDGSYEPLVLLSIFILIWTNDTFAFITGKTMGRRKLLEKISPKKTVEGFLGGLLAATVAGFLLARYTLDAPVLTWIILAVVVSITGTLGDLVQSKFKRVAMVKDSGRIMPGHGGILDRLDSVIFAAPFVFLFFQIISYVS